MKKVSTVVMLSTEKASKILLYTNTGIGTKDNILALADEIGLENILNENKPSNCQQQHLYFTTDERIEVGDWCVYKNKYVVQIKETDPSGYICSDRCKPLFHKVKKIVVSTDKSLGLPRPSNEFLKAYCDSYNSGIPITKVNIEYENIYDNWKDQFTGVAPIGKTIKIATDNTITISK